MSLETLDLTGIQVTKRNGQTENFDLAKITAQIEAACAGVEGVSASAIEMSFRLRVYSGIKTSEIQKALISSVSDMIEEDTPNYDLVAGRLDMFDLRKKVYGRFEPLSLREIIARGVEDRFYDAEIFAAYSAEEIDQFDAHIDWDSELNMTLQQTFTWGKKYLVRNRSTGKIYETPAASVMLMKMAAYFAEPDKAKRMAYVKDSYDTYKWESWATPNNAGLRTRTRQYASCTLIDTGDTMSSIGATYDAMMRHAAKRAGIGMNVGRLRSIGRPIRGGEAIHTGLVGFIKGHEALMEPVSQGGLRKGSMTVNFPIWHLEVESLLVLKNEKGEDSARARFLDYCVHLNTYLVKRFLNDEPITLFSPEAFPDLFEAFYSPTEEGQAKFIELYEKYENSLVVKSRKLTAQTFLKTVAPEDFGKTIGAQKQLSADEIFTLALTERKDTGRLYFFWADNVNIHSSFLEPVYMTNLCTEITLPTAPLETTFDENGRIALCNLAALNLGTLGFNDIERACRSIVRMADTILDEQEYLLPASREASIDYRPLGIGIINYAFFLAKNKVYYGSKEALELTNKWMEAISFYLIKASVELAKEKGPCRLSHKTKYGQGILPIDTYKRTVDEIVSPELTLDWEGLRQDLLKYGIRNATLMALMPAETSAGAVGGTNGFEPIRDFIVDKQSEGSVRQVVPGLDKYKKYYVKAWDMTDNVGYIKTVAVFQKWVDQAISANIYYNPKHHAEELIPKTVLIRDNLFLPSYYGLKTLYYCNTLDQSGEDGSDVQEEGCDSCKV